jgi:hypothetical protein
VGLVVVAEVALDLVRVDAHLVGPADPHAEGFVEGEEVYVESTTKISARSINGSRVA